MASKTTPAEFIRQVRREGKKVTWPSRKETLVSTLMVMILSVFAAVFFLLIDNLSSWAVQMLLGLGRL